MRGITITLVVKTQTGTDSFGQPVYDYAETSVANVLVGEPSTDDIQNALTLYGKTVAYTLSIPKGDTNIWEDTEVILPEPFGGRYRTIGIPTAGIDHLIPGPRNKKVRVERITG